MNVGVREPGEVLLELEAAVAAVEMPRQMQGGQQRNQRYRQREVADVPITAGKERQQNGSGERQEGDDGEDVPVDEVHRTPCQTMKAITAAAPAATQPA